MEEQLIIDDRTTPKGGLWIAIVRRLDGLDKNSRGRTRKFEMEFKMTCRRFLHVDFKSTSLEQPFRSFRNPVLRFRHWGLMGADV